jgi:hypothetical protein
MERFCACRYEVVSAVVMDNSAVVPLLMPDESPEFSEKVLSLAVGKPLLSSRFMLIEFGNAILS